VRNDRVASVKAADSTDAFHHNLRMTETPMDQAEKRRYAADVLRKAEARRGYLLPYHKMLGTHDPALLEAYDGFYQAFTLDTRSFTDQEREVVWAALLVAGREEYGDIHMRRGIEVGLTKSDLQDAVALAAAAESLQATDFAARFWPEWTPQDAIVTRYLRMAEAARGGIEPYLAEIALIVCHAARKSPQGMRIHLPRAFKAGASAAKIAEGVSYVILPCGGPTLVEACATWAKAAEDGLCPGPWEELT
jgi:alkylhydroperoxidase/carboxymuconolactone decarboxylase family protein YurZ